MCTRVPLPPRPVTAGRAQRHPSVPPGRLFLWGDGVFLRPFFPFAFGDGVFLRPFFPVFFWGMGFFCVPFVVDPEQVVAPAHAVEPAQVDPGVEPELVPGVEHQGQREGEHPARRAEEPVVLTNCRSKILPPPSPAGGGRKIQKSW